MGRVVAFEDAVEAEMPLPLKAARATRSCWMLAMASTRSSFSTSVMLAGSCSTS
ncbi:MAG: hypothetical protein U0792_20475 [Gemmataceae bacterium]